MAFVEQGTKQPVLSCFLAELDLSNKSFITTSSTLEKHKDTDAQGLFAARALDCLSKSSISVEPTLQLSSSSAIPHWMSSKQVQNISIETSLKSGSTGTVVAATSIPRFSQVHETLGSFSTLPSQKSGFGSKGQTNSNIVIESTDHLANSRNLFQQQVPAGLPIPVYLTPLLSLKSDGQKEEPKISKEDALSFLSHKEEKQPAKERLMDLPILSLGHSSGHDRAEVSSWVSKFPFQIDSTSEQAEHGQFIQHRDNLTHRLLTNSKNECLILGACKGVANIPSQFLGSKGQIDHCKFAAQHSLSSTEAANDVLPQKTSLANAPLNSLRPLQATISMSDVPSLKRDWNATLMQGVKNSQLLPDFFAQQKVTAAAKVNRSHFGKIEEMSSKMAFSQKSLASRVSEENAGFNLLSLHGAICSEKTRNSIIDHKSTKQQEMNNGGEALKTMTVSSEQSLHDSPRQVDYLIKGKHENLTEDSKTFKCVKFASRKSTEKHDKITSSDGKVRTKAIPLSSGPAADQAGMQPLRITSGVPVLSFPKHSSNLEGLEARKFPANKNTALDGDWGDFLAASSIGQAAKIDGKLVLPFQQRFEQLQTFLKKCDGSDNEYCFRALQSLSGTAQSNHSAELESRALRLSLEEGKEMKRAKLLNVLEDIPEGTFVNACARPNGHWFSASRAAAVVKEEA